MVAISIKSKIVKKKTLKISLKKMVSNDIQIYNYFITKHLPHTFSNYHDLKFELSFNVQYFDL
jgi:hypothetical protein